MRLIDANLSDIEDLVAKELSRHQSKLRDNAHPEAINKEWLTNSEAMDFLGLSRSTMQRYRDSGILTCSRIGTNIYYRRLDLIDLLENGLRIPHDEDLLRRERRTSQTG